MSSNIIEKFGLVNIGLREGHQKWLAMANNTSKLFQTIKAGMSAAIEMIGLDIVNTSQKDIKDRLYGSPLIQRILDSREFTQSSIEFLKNPLVIQYLDSVHGGENVKDKTPIYNIFRELLRRIDRCRDIEKAIEAVFNELLEILHSKEFHIRAFTILQNFKAENDFMLSSAINLQIRKCTHKDFSQFDEIIEGAITPWDEYNYSTTFYIAELDCDHLYKEEFQQQAEKTFTLLHWCLKLCDPRPVSISFISYVPKDYSWHPFCWEKTTRMSVVGSVDWDEGNEFFLDSNLFVELSKLIADLNDKINELPNTSRRMFELAMNEYIAADSIVGNGIIDIVIALESILLPGVDTELRFRLAQRAALIIGDNFQQRADVFSNMKRIYDIRSKLIHGELKKKEEELEKLYFLSRDYLRQSLLFLLDVRESDMGKYYDYLPFKD